MAYPQAWRLEAPRVAKIHLGIDGETLETRAVEATTGNVGDAPMLPELPARIPSDEKIATVTADGACDTRACHGAVADRGAAAIIPPRRNARPWKPDTAGARARNEILQTSKHLGRTLWRRWSSYRRRSRIETKTNRLKLPGQRLTSRDFDRQVAEVQIRVAVPNRFTALGPRHPSHRGRTISVPGERGKENRRHHLIRATAPPFVEWKVCVNIMEENAPQMEHGGDATQSVMRHRNVPLEKA